MTIQWVSEREADCRQHIANNVFKTKQDFFQLVGAYPEGMPPSFDRAVDWVIQKGSDIAELEILISIVSNQLDAQTSDDCVYLLMNWACAAALAKSPKLETWKRVKNLKYHSWQFEHWLFPAMMVYAQKSSDAPKAYIELAKEVINALDSFKLPSLSDRKNQEREGAWAFWIECRDKLDEIWWGLRGWRDPMNYEEELILFRVLNELAPDKFVSVIEQSANNPYLINSLLLMTGAGPFFPKFAEWKRIVVDAPIAFENDGTWNGSVLLPLLLAEARHQLLQTTRNFPRFDASDVEIESTKQEITNTVEAVVVALVKRSDSLPIFARWATWLMRQLLMHSEKDVNDVRSAAFIDNALIEAIGAKLKGQAVTQSSPKDASAWEVWCYRCVLAFHAHSGYIEPPDSVSFIAEWNISSDEWLDKGQTLQKHASLIVTSKEMPGIAAHLLAYPIVKLDDPSTTWITMWQATHTLREIVEFGNADALKDEYLSRSKAGELLLLLFRIGLAILDQRAAQCSSSNAPEAKSQAKLHEALASALWEMREIDDTLNRDQWLDAVRHLAVRRFIWEEQASENHKPGHLSIFNSGDKPTFVDYLRGSKNDVIELQSILQSVLLNAPDITRLQNDLDMAAVDLANILEISKRLNQYSPRRYPVDVTQLHNLESLISR